MSDGVDAPEERESGTRPAVGWVWSLATLATLFLAISAGAHVATLGGGQLPLGLILLLLPGAFVALGPALVLLVWLVFVHQPRRSAWSAALPLPVIAFGVLLALYTVAQVLRSAGGLTERAALEERQLTPVLTLGYYAAVCIFLARIRLGKLPK